MTVAPQPLKRQLSRTELGTLWVLLALSYLAAFVPTGIPGILSLVIGWIPVVFAFWHFTRWAGWRYALLGFVIIALVSFFVEAFGVATGLWFGNYYYPDGPLGPLLLGVPPLIQLQYFAMGYAALMIGRSVTGTLTAAARGCMLTAGAIIAAFGMTVLDLASDPRQSTQLGMWIWRDGGSYFGVPVQNFVGWFLETLIFFLLVQWMLTRYSAIDRIIASRPASFDLMGVLLYGTFPFAIAVRPLVTLVSGGTPTTIEDAMVAVALFAAVPLFVVALVTWWRNRSHVHDEGCGCANGSCGC